MKLITSGKPPFSIDYSTMTYFTKAAIMMFDFFVSKHKSVILVLVGKNLPIVLPGIYWRRNFLEKKSPWKGSDNYQLKLAFDFLLIFGKIKLY